MKTPRGYKTVCLPFESEEHHKECLSASASAMPVMLVLASRLLIPTCSGHMWV